MKKTLTYDNGTEMAEQKEFAKNTKIKVYFTHPYSPWEKSTNENSNGLIRDYFPKGSDFNLITKKRFKEVQNQLNERPRKVIDHFNPEEVFQKYIIDPLFNQNDKNIVQVIQLYSREKIKINPKIFIFFQENKDQNNP